MMYPKMAGDTPQVHPTHVQLDGFLAHLFGISPGFGVCHVLD